MALGQVKLQRPEIGDFQEWSWEEMNRQSTENVMAVQTLYGIVMMDTCGYTFVQTGRMNTLIVNSKVNYRHSVNHSDGSMYVHPDH